MREDTKFLVLCIVMAAAFLSVAILGMAAALAVSSGPCG